MTSSAILDLINMYVDSSLTIVYKKKYLKKSRIEANSGLHGFSMDFLCYVTYQTVMIHFHCFTFLLRMMDDQCS